VDEFKELVTKPAQLGGDPLATTETFINAQALVEEKFAQLKRKK
jgi:hypothetical protein